MDNLKKIAAITPIKNIAEPMSHVTNSLVAPTASKLLTYRNGHLLTNVEIGDYPCRSQKTVAGYKVQTEWSNKANNCV